MRYALGLILVGLIGAGVWAGHPKGADQPLTMASGQPPSAPAQGALHLLVMGTSLTTNSPWPQYLETQLQSCHPSPVTLAQIAKGAETSRWALANIPQNLATVPDIVLVEFMINDADIRRGISLKNSYDNHRALIETLRRANPDVRIVLLRLNRAYGLKALLRPRLGAYESRLEDIALQDRVGLLDLRPLWAKAGSQVLPDGIHPTPQAALEINGQSLAIKLARMLGIDCGA